MLKSIQTNCSFIDELTLTNKLREETTKIKKGLNSIQGNLDEKVARGEAKMTITVNTNGLIVNLQRLRISNRRIVCKH